MGSINYRLEMICVAKTDEQKESIKELLDLAFKTSGLKCAAESNRKRKQKQSSKPDNSLVFKRTI